jgi:UDP-N-acetylmuramate-alanine ligase
VYRQRDEDSADGRISSAALYEELRKTMGDRAVFIEDMHETATYLGELQRENSVIVFMGAGDIDEVARRYAQANDA